MDWPDYLILGIIAISVLVGALRGFVKEAFSLLVWAVAFLAAFYLSGPIADWLQDSISLPSARTALAFAGIFIAVLLVGGLLNYLLGKLVEKTGLTGTDRLLGGVFGACRGLILVVALILVAGFTPIPGDPWWSESRTVQSLLPLAEWASTFLPESILSHLDLYAPPEITAREA
jgi:membrane protein required for colicin V production